ncbi:hypothetical protein AB2M95_02470 [Pseudomonas chlororaphis]|uniref:hypothetical protein n=1 Tax=Pseudomonas chlororaphis TaxID=587753 RepID=UPI0034633EC6
MRKPKRLIYGVGVNDADYPLFITQAHGDRRKTTWVCPFYKAWTGMLERCYSAKFQQRNPTYCGCSVAPAWLVFSVFRSWMAQQEHQGKHLDKDILFPGNKVYSSNACVFVTPEVNKFVIDSGATRGEWPVGVAWHKGREKFVAQCRDPLTGKHKFLGYFISPESAHEAWREYKHRVALAYADRQPDHRVAAALRARYAKPLTAKAA